MIKSLTLELLRNCEFEENPPRSSKTRHLRVFPKSAAPGPKVTTGGGGGWLGSPSYSPFPCSKLFFICLLLIYKWSRSFYWCKLFLLIQSCILMLCSNSGMVTNYCIAQNSERHNCVNLSFSFCDRTVKTREPSPPPHDNLCTFYGTATKHSITQRLCHLS